MAAKTRAQGKPPKPSSKAPAPAQPKSRRAEGQEADEAAEPASRELASKKDYQLNQALNLLKGMQIMKKLRA
jgi:carboxyl-terminal processing protease